MTVPMMETEASPISRKMVSFREEKNLQRVVARLSLSVFTG
jgi:hypothetical protein